MDARGQAVCGLSTSLWARVRRHSDGSVHGSPSRSRSCHRRLDHAGLQPVLQPIRIALDTKDADGNNLAAAQACQAAKERLRLGEVGKSISITVLSVEALERAAIHIARPLGLDAATTPVLDARPMRPTGALNRPSVPLSSSVKSAAAIAPGAGRRRPANPHLPHPHRHTAPA